MDWIKKIMRISLLVFTLVVGISCTVSYKFNGGNINYDKVKTISIADFPIKCGLCLCTVRLLSSTRT